MNSESFKNSLSRHKQNVLYILKLTPAWVVVVPFLFMFLIYALDQTALSPFLTKPNAEIAGPTIVFVALLMAVWQLKKSDHVYYKWLAFFALILFLRELHFYGTNNGFYIAFLLMVWWASQYRERLEPYFSHRVIVTLLVTTIWVYLVSKTFDKRFWDDFLPKADITSDLFEENLEIAGHLLFFYLVLYSSKLRNLTK